MLKHEYGVPPGYDTYVSDTGSKRSIIERRECGNCSEEFEAGYGEFVPPAEMTHFRLHWCSAECFLSYAYNSMNPRQYTLLEAAVRTLENRCVERRPSRFLLQKNGGHIPTEEYLYGTSRPMIEGGKKRVKMKPQEGEDEELVFEFEDPPADDMEF